MPLPGSFREPKFLSEIAEVKVDTSSSVVVSNNKSSVEFIQEVNDQSYDNKITEMVVPSVKKVNKAKKK